MKCNDCESNKAYRRKGLAWRLCKSCWANLLGIITWASEYKPSDHPKESTK